MLCQLCEFVTKPEFPELQKLLDLNLNKSESCILCKGKANEYINIIKKALEELNKIHPEQKLTLGISSTIHHEILTNENLIITDMKCSFKTLINHLLKEEIKRMNKFVIAVQPQNSQLLLTIDFVSNSVKLTNNHLFILAKYKKYSRNICQNLWICEYCRGKGCEKCNSSGYKYLSIAKICETGIRNVLKIKHFYLHANGREDVDVMTLGNGRYCVLEFKPTKLCEEIDLHSLENAINREAQKYSVKIKLLKLVNRSFLNIVTESEFDKHYRAIVRTETEISQEVLERLENELTNRTIMQRTPKRVEKRRADMIRKKIVKSCKCKIIDNNTFEMRVICQSGTYVKELIHGDNGRTKPSVAEILKTKAVCIQLDIEKFEDDFIELYL